MRSTAALAVLFAAIPFSSAAASLPPKDGRQLLSNLPASFEPNRGQADHRFDYVSRGMGYSFSVGPEQALLELASPGQDKSSPRFAAVRLKMLGVNRRAHGRALQPQAGKSNYFIGNDSARWLKDVPRYGRVEYRQIYPGVDIAYYGTGSQLEYDFVLGPHADPRKIRMQVEGAEKIEIDGAGDLVLHAAGAEIREKRPLVYQDTPAGRKLLEARYVALGGNRVGFQIRGGDPAKSLVIDPSLVFSTYFGGTGNDLAANVVLDSSGNYYVSGFSRSTPLGGTKIGQPLIGSPGIASFVAKLSPAGTLIFATYIGGANDQGIAHVALDSSNNIYLAGDTTSANFPTLNPIPGQGVGGGYDGYVLELNSTGNALVYSTYLGGNGDDIVYGIQVDSLGEAYIVGTTRSSNLQVTLNPVPSQLSGVQNAFAAKLSAGPNPSLSYFRYFGGSKTDYVNGLALDGSGNSYMFGDTNSVNFPALPLASKPACTWPGGHGWLTMLDLTGAVVYSTFICGTNGGDAVRGAALAPGGNLVIVGETDSTTFPTTPNAFQLNYGGGGDDAFVMELSPSGGLLYSTYLGGNGDDGGGAVAVDALGNWYVTGDTASTNFFLANPIQNTNLGSQSNGFLTKFASPSSIVFSTYFGGSIHDAPVAIAVDAVGRAYIAGRTNSPDFPRKNALQSTLGACGAGSGGGCDDGFWSVIATCDYTVSSPGGIASSGGGGTISITTTPECGWTATTLSPWITFTPSQPSGIGNGSVSYTIAANSGAPRSGSIAIGTHTINITQGGVISTTLTSSPSGASVTVTGAGCAPGPYITPANLTWNAQTCTVRFGDPQTFGGVSYSFKSSTVNGTATSSLNPLTVTPGANSLTINATYAAVIGASPGTATHFSVTAPASAAAGVSLQFTVTALDAGNNPVTGFSDPVHFTGTDGSAALPADATLTNGAGTFTASLVTVGTQTITASDLFTPSINGTSAGIVVSAASGLRLVPVTPCRLYDTRNLAQGGPFITGNTSRNFTIPGACGVPSTAQAYSLNVAVVPHTALGFLTVWPTGQTQPTVATLNSIDGRIKSNAAIVPAGAGGAISVYATNDTDVVLDINGYFVPASTPGALAFYPMTPCRVVDTRNGTLLNGQFTGGNSRTVQTLSSSCNVPAAAQAYSLNFTVVASGQVGFVTAYPTGVTRPVVATLNATPPLPLAATPVVIANAAIVPVGTGGSIDVYATNPTDLVVDINGYFAPPGAGGMSLYALSPCRVLDTRKPAGSPPFTGSIDVNVLGAVCGGTPQAQGYVFNATAVPPAPLGFLTMWPQGTTQPTVATLNALDGAITNNMAIVPTNNTEVSAFGSNATHLVLDMFGYFAP
ncbi:MAG TPA: SBBP repeat-containing protein [Bryobacteraceae bacterium]